MHELAYLLNRRRIEKGVVDHQRQPAPISLVDKSAHHFRAWRQRLLHQNMLAGLESRKRQFVVCMHRRSDGDCIDARILEQVLVAASGGHSRIEALARRELLRIEVG